MDNFDLDSLEISINKSKNNIINKLDSLQLSEKTFANQCDDVCYVIDYSPKVLKKQNYLGKYQIQPEYKKHDSIHVRKSNINLNLENKIPSPNPNDDDDEDEEEEEEDEEEEDEDDDHGKKIADSFSISQRNKYNNLKGDNPTNQLGFSSNQGKNIFEGSANSYKEGRRESGAYSQENSMNKEGLHYNIDKDRLTMPISSMHNRLLLEGKIRVYVLNTEKFLEFDINGDETFRVLKKKVLDKLEAAANFTLDHHTTDSYEFRRVNKYRISQMEELPIDDNENVRTKGEDIVSFLEKRQFFGIGRSNAQQKTIKLVGNVISSSDVDVDKINLRITIKLDINNPSSTILQLSSESTLKNVVNILADKCRIPYKNIDKYYFVEHSSTNASHDCLEDAISPDISLKDLNIFEVDLYYLTYQDQPAQNSYTINKKVFVSNKTEKRLSDDISRESAYNTKSAHQYQEFEVFKIKKTKAKQERMLGIDQYYLYNENPKKITNATNIITLLNSKIKHPLRKVKYIKDVGVISNKSLYIEVINVNEDDDDDNDDDDDETIKKIVYEAKSTSIRNEIVNKIKFLIKKNKEKEVK